MTEDIQKQEKIGKRQTEKDINEETTKKEIAKESIEEIMGKSAVSAAREAREILEVADALASGNPSKISREKRDTDLKTVRDYQEKMAKNKNLANELAAIGLGSEQLAVTGRKLEERINEVANEMEVHGEDDKGENGDNPEKSPQNQKNETNSELYLSPNIPPQPDGRIIDNLEQAYEAGKNFSSKIPGTDNVVADAAAEVAGKVAEAGAKEALGKSLLGEVGGKVAKKVTKELVRNTLRGGLTN